MDWKIQGLSKDNYSKVKRIKKTTAVKLTSQSWHAIVIIMWIAMNVMVIMLHYFFLGRLGSGSLTFSLFKVQSNLLPRQFPHFGGGATELTTLRAWVFFWNSSTFGLSFTPSLCRWRPKNLSKGSWHILWLKKDLTSGRVNKYLTSSTKDLPETIDH